MYNAVTLNNDLLCQLMNILLNGKPRTIEDDLYLSRLIEQLDLKDKRLAVEINREIIPKSQHDQYKIQQDDTVEIVFAIGGG